MALVIPLSTRLLIWYAWYNIPEDTISVMANTAKVVMDRLVFSLVNSSLIGILEEQMIMK